MKVIVHPSMRFTKMQGVGNDFVLVNAADAPVGMDWPVFAVRACARQFGVGADGLLVVSQAPPGAASPPLSMRMFNPDGTEDMCGNGLRCIGLWAYQAGWVKEREFAVATKEGTRLVQILDSDGTQGLLRVAMGLPQFAPADIPFLGTSDRVQAEQKVVNFPLPVADDKYLITSLNTGSTHTVIFGKAPDEDTFQRVSRSIEEHPLFPERTSVLWATLTGWNTVGVRIWERGAGETFGCGTGACAVGVAAILRGLVTNKPVDVVSRGGTLRIAWAGEGREILMTGPAQVVFEGEIAIDEPF